MLAAGSFCCLQGGSQHQLRDRNLKSRRDLYQGQDHHVVVSAFHPTEVTSIDASQKSKPFLRDVLGNAEVPNGIAQGHKGGVAAMRGEVRHALDFSGQRFNNPRFMNRKNGR